MTSTTRARAEAGPLVSGWARYDDGPKQAPSMLGRAELLYGLNH